MKFLLSLLFSLNVLAATDAKLNTTYLFMKEPSPGEHKVTIVPPALSADYQLTLPPNDGSPGYVLQTNGAGLLTWENPIAGGTVTEIHMSAGPTNVLKLTTTTAGTIPDSITTYGTFDVSLINQSAAVVLAGPVSGADSAPSFRSLIATDIPNLDASKITTGKAALSTSTTGVTITSGANALFTSAAIDIQTATGAQPGLISAADWTTFNNKGVGTVTSVSGGTGLTGGPITTVGSLSIANTGVTAATYGSSGSVPIITVNAQGQLTSVTSGAINAGSIITGILAIANGGTGNSTASGAFNALSPTNTAGDISYYSGSTNIRLPIGSAGQFLKVANGEPTWAASTATPAFNYVSKAINYTAVAGDAVDANSGSAFTITLPTAASIAGSIVKLKVTGSGTVTLATTSSQTIDGMGSLAVANGNVEVISDGSNWKATNFNPIVYLNVSGNAGTISANNPLKFPTVVSTTHSGAYSASTGQFTVPFGMSGYYQICGFANSDTSSAFMYTYINGTVQVPYLAFIGSTGFNGTVGGCGTFYATAGQTIDLRLNGSITVTSTGTGMTIFRLR